MAMIIKLKPHLLMVMVQIGYAFLFLISEDAFNHGLNPHVYITYRHVAAGFVMFPFAFLLERNQRPQLTVRLFAEIFILSLLGVGLTLNLFNVSLKYTSPTFVASMDNSIAALTFLIAVVLRMERLDLRNPRGIANLAGTLISLSGVMTMAFYKGSVMKSLWKPLIHRHAKFRTTDKSWPKGIVISVASCISWSLWYIMQSSTLKRYPAQLSLTTWMSFVGAAQSAVFAGIIQHKIAAWKIGFNIDLWSILYGGVVVSGLLVYVQLWCTKATGPVFVTAFNPVSTILTATLSYFILGEKLYLGSIVGAVIVFIGLYMLLWGKAGVKKSEITVTPDMR